MYKFKCKKGHSKFTYQGTKYATDVNGIVATADKGIAEFLKQNKNFDMLDTPKPEQNEEVKPSSTAKKKTSRK